MTALVILWISLSLNFYLFVYLLGERNLKKLYKEDGLWWKNKARQYAKENEDLFRRWLKGLLP
jgi:hypothetical protein